MPGTLYVVATPIGNLEDVTLRALRILREVSLIAAEDTRRTGRLLQHYSISTRTTSLHEHNEREKSPKLVERLLAGESIALVTDAGTPAISDPGCVLIAAARTAGVRVESIPGPSAVMAALSSSGLDASEFTFVGFAPSRSKDLSRWLETVHQERRLVVFFEAPHRIAATLKALGLVYGADHVIGIGRELTKAHDELVIQPISALVERFREARGELTVLLPPDEIGQTTKSTLPASADLHAELQLLLDRGATSRRAALRTMAAKYGVSPNELYDLIKVNTP
jgi:16S rRNA (cytidine1402-2'-O)-methyltransferase